MVLRGTHANLRPRLRAIQARFPVELMSGRPRRRAAFHKDGDLSPEDDLVVRVNVCKLDSLIACSAWRRELIEEVCAVTQRIVASRGVELPPCFTTLQLQTRTVRYDTFCKFEAPSFCHDVPLVL